MTDPKSGRAPTPGATLEPAREIAPGVHLVDTGYVRPWLAASYVVRGGDSAAVVETGSATAVPRILAALEAARIRREEVAWVVVTHVHLDHAGGAGALLAELPRARLAVHSRGARHLVDPSKLVAGTMAVYGEARFKALYGTLVPAPAERVTEAPDGFEIDLGGRVLRCLDAPGHAKHHFVVWDEASRGFVTGDAFGLSYRELDGPRGPFFFPTTTPVQLDPPALHATVARMLSHQPRRMYLTHYGMVEGDVGAWAGTLLRGLDEHVRIARAAPAGPGRHQAIKDGLRGQLRAAIAEHGSPIGMDRAVALFEDDLELNAQGLGVWLDGQGR